MDAIHSVHVVGAGGIGLAVGHSLARAGVAVTFIETDRQKLAWGNRHGAGLGSHPSEPAAFVAFDDWRPEPHVPVILATKCYDNAAVLNRLSPDAFLVPIQNGFDAELEARSAHVEGIASFVSECVPGQTITRITRPGKLHLGVNPAAGLGPHDPLLDRARQLAALLRNAPFPIEIVPDVRPFKYTKLMYNAALSPLASAAGVDNGDLLRLPRVRALFFALLRENYAILRHAGVPLGKVGPLAPSTVAWILARPWLANLFALGFAPGLRGAYCSMFLDLPRGRTEVENYNGHLLRLAGDRPHPLNTMVRDLIRRMEAGRITPSPAVLEPLLKAVESKAGPAPSRLPSENSFSSEIVDDRVKAL
jgi:2-dehydropantoate 2-reductase